MISSFMANLNLLTLNGLLAHWQRPWIQSPSLVGIQFSPTIKSASLRLEVGISPILSKKKNITIVGSKDKFF